MKACEGAQGIVYRIVHIVYMIKGSCIQYVHNLVSITEQLIRLMPKYDEKIIETLQNRWYYA
jgi:hypothetical protein